MIAGTTGAALGEVVLAGPWRPPRPVAREWAQIDTSWSRLLEKNLTAQ